MSIWTRIAEAIANVGESLSAFLSRLRTRRPPEQSLAFTIGLIALGAKMAKADGLVTGAEVEAFKQVFHVPPEELGGVARVFNLAKQDTAGYDIYARQIARLFQAKAEILEDVLDALFHIAKAGEGLHPAELAFLAHVAEIFGFSEHDFAVIRARHMPSEDPYVVLGLAPAATPEEIKARYRKLVRENHPDRHIAAGMPEEMVDIATQRLQRINDAYAKIMREAVV